MTGSPATSPDGPEAPDPEASAASAAQMATEPLLRRARDLGSLRSLAAVLVILATSLYLLERLEPVLRPLLIALLLCYLFLPAYNRLRRHMRPVLAFLIIVVGLTIGLQGLARLVYRDVEVISHNLPRYMEREEEIEAKLRDLTKSWLPMLEHPRAGEAPGEADSTLTAELSRRIVGGAASAFVNVFLESLVIAFYMIFLLQSASRFPARIRASFPADRSRGLLAMTESINRAISEYLVVKVKASLLVAIPAAVACWAFGITGAVTWGTITFFGNFLPYVGALVAILPPITLAVLEYHSLWPPLFFAVILLSIHGITSNLIEPAMTGKALGLNPLVVLVGLAFWSLIWGFVGLVLAVPLTVIFKIILERTPATRPIALLMAEDDPAAPAVS
ncbi:AI-2 transport protein TqsA [Aquisphaera giovannonii]|uniref:AI-2 transport protein TqsA n=1 Tax=Aquisphaera giovannonii TaxID=406548 RepID=A0A5B9WB33_9BACT|nr:AI-2E family transporter [Aquisphaera giovannonii]QEH37762.1 AI-2 transport protein TqsA [Aquisphaera giovannonii]